MMEKESHFYEGVAFTTLLFNIFIGLSHAIILTTMIGLLGIFFSSWSVAKSKQKIYSIVILVVTSISLIYNIYTAIQFLRLI